MNDEAVNDPRNDATDEQRLMALLALTAQELPYVPRNADALAPHPEQSNAAHFQHLDADPAALETYLRKGMRKPQHSSSTQSLSLPQRAMQALADWLAPPQVRFAAAFVVVLLAGLLTIWQWNANSVLDEVGVSYSNSLLRIEGDSLSLPWEQRSPTQGFAPAAGNDTPAGRSFAQGLLRGRAKLTGRVLDSQSPFPRAMQGYVALGEWNVLLWAATQSSVQPDADFWRAQAALARRLGEALQGSDDAPTISAHVTLAEPLLLEMARAPNPRTARQLANELVRFREAFAPHVAPDPI